jgi:hypothetical protein
MRAKTDNPRRARRGARTAALAAVAGLAASGAIALGPVAQADIVKSFEVWNLSSADLTLYAYDTDQDRNVHTYIPSVPPVGTTIKPGHNFHVDVHTDSDEHCTRTIPRFSGRDANASGQAQNWRILLEVYCANSKLKDLRINCAVGGNPPPARQTAACGNYIGKDGNVATVADGPDGTTVTVPASDKAKQAEINQAFCQNPYKDALSIKCFDNAKAVDVYAGWTHWELLKT